MHRPPVSQLPLPPHQVVHQQQQSHHRHELPLQQQQQLNLNEPRPLMHHGQNPFRQQQVHGSSRQATPRPQNLQQCNMSNRQRMVRIQPIICVCLRLMQRNCQVSFYRRHTFEANVGAVNLKYLYLTLFLQNTPFSKKMQILPQRNSNLRELPVAPGNTNMNSSRSISSPATNVRPVARVTQAVRPLQSTYPVPGSSRGRSQVVGKIASRSWISSRTVFRKEIPSTEPQVSFFTH